PSASTVGRPHQALAANLRGAPSFAGSHRLCYRKAHSSGWFCCIMQSQHTLALKSRYSHGDSRSSYYGGNRKGSTGGCRSANPSRVLKGGYSRCKSGRHGIDNSPPLKSREKSTFFRRCRI